MILSSAVFAGNLTPTMEEYLSMKSAGDTVEAMLVLKDRVAIKALDIQLYEAGTTRASRHATVMNSLMDRANATQASLLADLEVRQQLGEINSYESFWVVNCVFVTGSEEAIRDLALRDDIDVVEAPLAIELIEPVNRELPDQNKDANGIGITPGVVNVGARRVWSDLGVNGEGALVCNFDTGVDGNHPALYGSWRGHSAPAEACWLDLSGSTSFPYDGSNHGTHTMGTMIGVAPDDTIGVAPRAKWIASNVIIGGNLGGKFLTAMQWLMDPDGDPSTTDDVPDAVNHSWGVNESFGYPDCYSAWWEAIDAAEAAGMVHVWATGNEGPYGSTVRSPADRATTAYDSFSVGSTNYYPPYNISPFSSRGPAGPNCGPEELRIKPEVVAPGGNIYSSIPGGGYTYMGGTSMATPHVAGVVALMRSANPDLDVITIKQILMDTALDLGAAGEDNNYGHGFIDAYEAVLAAMSGYGLVVGTVIDDDSGDPLMGVDVAIEGSQQRTTTDEMGAFRVNAPAGALTLNFSVFGYGDVSENYEVVAGEELNPMVGMTLLPQVILAGTVHAPGTTVPGENPIEGATVIVDGTPLDVVVTGTDGRFAISAPRADSYTIRASVSAVGSVVQNFPATADMDCDLYLRNSPEDGFESGDFNSMEWRFSGADWTTTEDNPHEGRFAAKSGAMGGGSTSQLILDVELAEAGPVSFWIRTTGSGGTMAFWDGFATIETWEDVNQWTQYVYEAAAGTHAFRWRFSTASGGGSGDHGLVDLVILPGGEEAAPRAVACPWTMSVDVPTNGTAEATLLVQNQGVEDLDWSLDETANWLSLAPGSGTLVPAGFAEVTLSFDASGLAEGSHTTELTLNSNDPNSPSVPVLVQMVVGTVSAVETPSAFALHGAVPNPFNPQTMVHFSLPASEHVRLGLYDIQGRLVRSLVDGVRGAGPQQVLWDGRDHSGRSVASGTYFARLEAGGLQSVKSMVLVR